MITVIITAHPTHYMVEGLENEHPISEPQQRIRNYEVVALAQLYLGRKLEKRELQTINLLDNGDSCMFTGSKG